MPDLSIGRLGRGLGRQAAFFVLTKNLLEQKFNIIKLIITVIVYRIHHFTNKQYNLIKKTIVYVKNKY